MKNIVSSVGGLIVVIGAALIVFSQLGMVDIRWPWENPIVASRASAVTQPKEATIVEIEPIALDCRARIHSVVPIEGRREHRALGQVYRTDTISMTAIGDIDTCVDSAAAQIVTNDDGTVQVTIDGAAIEFVRPRVDTVATLGSVHVDKGFIGHFTDAFPWVSDDTGLTPGAYAYAQTVIGSSECMEEAFEVTKLALAESYEAQMRAAGLDPADLQLDIVGTPDFASGEGETVPDDYRFIVDGDAATCSVDDAAFAGASTTGTT